MTIDGHSPSLSGGPPEWPRGRPDPSPSHGYVKALGPTTLISFARGLTEFLESNDNPRDGVRW